MKIIAFCGIDGAGKSTQIDILRSKLEREGKKVKVLKTEIFPLYLYKNDVIDNDILALSTALDFLKTYFAQNLKEYDFVLCDRYTLCHISFAQTYNVNNMDLLNALYSLVQKPDITIYFKVDLSVALDRIANRTSKKRQFDETEEILGPTLCNYEKNIITNKNKCVIVDANRNVKYVTEQILKYI